MAAEPASGEPGLAVSSLPSGIRMGGRGSTQALRYAPELNKDGPRLGQIRQFSIGSGSVIDLEQRLVLTNSHVVGDSEKATVSSRSTRPIPR